MSRTILHADMDAFFASVEQRDDPSLRGRPVAVGGAAPRGVIAAASYEARTYGVRSAMPTVEALRRCPHLILIPSRHGHYSRVSRDIFAIFGRFSPLVEPLSVDEAFLDITGTERLYGPPAAVAQALKDQVREELDLVVSVGIGPSKHVAKIASDLGKPDGLVVVTPGEVKAFLHPLPVSRILGVGRVTEERLRRQGVTTVGQLAALPRELLVSWFGEHGRQLWELAQGEDAREVIVDHSPESIGQEDTFSQDIDDLVELSRHVQDQADRVARRLRAEGYQARVVVLKVKTADFKLRTRRKTLPRPTDDQERIGQTAKELLAALKRTLGPLRLTGVTAAGLVVPEEPRQLSLVTEPADGRRALGSTLDAIADRFGQAALVRGSALGAETRCVRGEGAERRPSEPRHQGSPSQRAAGRQQTPRSSVHEGRFRPKEEDDV